MADLHWFPCELHCHTLHSDGDFSVAELLQTAHERLLDGICLTDHNTTAGLAEASRSRAPVALGGMEWTTYFGHMPVLDCSAYVDWRDARVDGIDEKLRQIHACGGLAGVAHPFQIGTPICTGGYWEYRVRDWSLVDYLEIWSEGSPYLNTSNRRAIALWESLLDRGYHIAPTFGRDWHRTAGNKLISACTYLGCMGETLTPVGMKTALQSGKTVVSAGPLFYFKTERGETVGDVIPAGKCVWRFVTDRSRVVRMQTENTFVPKEIRVYTNGGRMCLCLPAEGERQTATLDLEPAHWYRAELWGETDGQGGCQLAVTAPIYTQHP